MVSAPSPGITSPHSLQSSPQNVGAKRDTHHEFKSAGTWTPLRKIAIRSVEPGPKEWMALIDAIDFSALEHLDLDMTNFSQEQLKQLVDRISGYSPSTVPLETLIIADTNLVKNTNSQALEAMLAELRKQAPLVKVVGY